MRKNILFTTIAILVPAIIFLFIGCMKPPNTGIDKGVDVPCAVIDAKISSIQRPSVLAIAKSEYTYIETAIRLENQQPDVNQQYAITVMDRKEDPYMIQLTIHEETNEKVNGVFKQSIKEGPVLLTKGTSTLAASLAVNLPPASSTPAGVMQMSKKLRISSSGAATGQGFNCANQAAGHVISYNNLEVSSIDIPVPPIVQARPNCGLKNCNGPIAGQLMKFDRWIPDPNKPGSEMKVTSYVVTSPDVPYFATIFSQCVQYSWPLANRQILVTSCDDVKDFKFGVTSGTL
jgi:hypothetical protein